MSKSYRPYRGSRNYSSRSRFSGPQRRRGSPIFNPTFFIQDTQTQASIKSTAPQHNFADFKLHHQIEVNIKSKGYQSPTPIQDQTIPLILNHQDVVGVANTGTGKTAAFLIPLINQALQAPSQKVLIITPTRELADQIQQEFKSLSNNLKVFSTLCIGGVGLNRQIHQLRRNPQFVIGTPGRLKDLSQKRFLNLSLFTAIVLDEVDRMLDMGFIHDIKFLINLLSPQRQSLFFTATLEGKVNQVMKTFLRNPAIISVKTQPIADNINQKVVKIGGKNKVDVLHDLLAQDGFNRVLVFGRTKWGMEKLSKSLDQRGFKAATIHGNKSQNQRQRALNQLKTGQVKILLATDVAQRGLDIKNLTHVINFDLPESKDDYIHRIGRTARADKPGIAITLVP